ncbi:MAG: hypothetical protein AABX33_07425 [Nanoarchaeota archaeon]
MSEDKATAQSKHAFDFWKLAVKWYFFPLLYIILTLLFTIIVPTKGHNLGDLFRIFLVTLYYLPNGLVYLILVLSTYPKHRFGNVLIYLFPIVFHVFWIASAIIIQFFKVKKGRILRWLVITVFLAMLLSFLGCTKMVLTDKVFGNF